MDELMQLIERLPKERKTKMQAMLKNAPYWLLSEFTIEKIQKGTTFIRMGEPSAMVYILLNGRVKAIDRRMYDVEYDYTHFEPIEIFGMMEFFMKYDTYIATLATTEECCMLKIPREIFEQWLLSDLKMAFNQVSIMMRRLDDQAIKERLFLFMDATHRVYYLFSSLYKEYGKKGKCVLQITNEKISGSTGINIRSVNRSIHAMVENGLLTKVGRKIIITEEQYLKMKKMLETSTKLLQENSENE